MSNEPTIFVTPPARIVWGHPIKSKPKTNQRTKQKVLDDAGNEISVWAFGLSWDTATFEQQVFPYLNQEALKMFPNGTPNDFSWKYKTENNVDNKGKLYGEREGYKGCYVLTCSTELKAPDCFRRDQNGTFMQIGENDIKTGDYVIAELIVKANESPGIYVNPNMICLVGVGQPILSYEADPNTAFANANFQLPQGAQPVQVGTVGQPNIPPQVGGAPIAASPMQPSVVPSTQPSVGIASSPSNVPVAPTAPIPGQSPLPGGGGAAPQGAVTPQQNAPLPGGGIVQPATMSPTSQPQPAYDFVQQAVNGQQG